MGTAGNVLWRSLPIWSFPSSEAGGEAKVGISFTCSAARRLHERIPHRGPLPRLHSGGSDADRRPVEPGGRLESERTDGHTHTSVNVMVSAKSVPSSSAVNSSMPRWAAYSPGRQASAAVVHAMERRQWSPLLVTERLVGRLEVVYVDQRQRRGSPGVSRARRASRLFSGQVQSGSYARSPLRLPRCASARLAPTAAATPMR